MAEKLTTGVLPVLLLVVGIANAGSLVGHWAFDEGAGTIVHDLSGS